VICQSHNGVSPNGPAHDICSNSDCPARGQVGQGNIHIHSRKKQRYRCRQCGKTFTASNGTPLYRRHQPLELVVCVVTLLAYGCPPPAIVHAFGWDERTVYALLHAAGQHCEQVHQHLVQPPRALQHIQADELRVKLQSKIVWVAMALEVRTRLWLGGVVSCQRDLHVLIRLMQGVRQCALRHALLICVDGLRSYKRAVQRVFREALPHQGRGCPRLRRWANLCLVQIVKYNPLQPERGMLCRLVQGTGTLVCDLLQRTRGAGVANTAYIERLNATFRARWCSLVRRGRALLRQPETLHQGLYLIGTVYNFCSVHTSLRVRNPNAGLKWLEQTPAMAAGLTEHCWSVQELLRYRVPPPRWTPPKRRGRPSKHMKALIARWCA
jgi:transposase-like protein